MREERLRATAQAGDGLGLSSWRGRSGRRVVVAVHAIASVDADDLDGTVALAVAREPSGAGEGAAARARIVGVTLADALPDTARRGTWLARAAERGASEIHLHRLAETPQARAAVARDLGGSPSRSGVDGSREVAYAARDIGARRRPARRRGASDEMLDTITGGLQGGGGTGRRPARR
ncbi:hypothetical protein [Salinarimonas ramus]|uniref:hypothetical protein n=1 Tax=Salinarimonas ramus TaxID=690164 RepID=UPI0016668964|nr:hypothetical protein [Salinarimonas ramus]